MNFWKWAGAFTVYTLILMGLAESEEYEDLGVTIAWLAALGSLMLYFEQADKNLADLIGTG